MIKSITYVLLLCGRMAPNHNNKIQFVCVQIYKCYHKLFWVVFFRFLCVTVFYYGFFLNLLTMSTVTSPTLVEPWLLRKAFTASCSCGIFSASTSFNDLSPEMFRTNVVIDGRAF